MTSTVPTQLQVRDPDLSEFEPLQRLWFESWQHGHASILPEEVKGFRTFERFADRLKAVWPTLRVAGPLGAPLGLCAIKGDELWQLFVGAAGRGTGVANALLADGERRLAASGVKVAWLACAIGNDRAAHFYEKCGWYRAGTTINRIEMPGGTIYELEVWKYEKRL